MNRFSSLSESSRGLISPKSGFSMDSGLITSCGQLIEKQDQLIDIFDSVLESIIKPIQSASKNYDISEDSVSCSVLFAFFVIV